MFAVDQYEKVAGACIAWRDSREEECVASLHWLVVHPSFQGKGLGRALCQKVMQIFNDFGEMPVYIHTQPWSYQAILLYISVGFQLQMTDCFSHYENQYTQAMEALHAVLNQRQYDLLVQNSEK